MRWRYSALAATLALATGCADVRSPVSTDPGQGTSAALVASLGALGPLLQPALDGARVGAGPSAGSLGQLTRTREAYVARLAAGDPEGAYALESQLRLEAAERIVAQLGPQAVNAFVASADSACDQLRSRLRDGTGDGPLQDRLRLADRLCDAAGAALRAGRPAQALDYAAQALETANGWQGPPEWATGVGAGSADRQQLRDGSCDSDGDGVPDQVRQRARDGSGSGR